MKDYTEYFEVRIRKDSSRFYCLKDENVPDELRFLVREIHLNEFYDAMPCDWIYDRIYSAYDRLKECETESNFYDACSEIIADCFSGDLFEWAKNGYAQEYIQESLEENREIPTINHVIELAQVRAIEAIYRNVWEFLQKNEEPK